MDFDALRDEGFDLYNNLVKDCKNDKEIPKLDYSDLRDSFRQHVNNRRNESSENLILDYYSIRNIVKLKQELSVLMDKFEVLKASSRRPANSESSCNKNFVNSTELAKFLVSNEEIMQSEKWKLEKIVQAIESIKGTAEEASEEPTQPIE